MYPDYWERMDWVSTPHVLMMENCGNNSRSVMPRLAEIKISVLVASWEEGYLLKVPNGLSRDCPEGKVPHP